MQISPHLKKGTCSPSAFEVHSLPLFWTPPTASMHISSWIYVHMYMITGIFISTKTQITILICIENWMLYKLITRSFCSSRSFHYLHEYYITQSSKSFQCKWVKYLLWISIIFTHVCLSKNSLREKSNLLSVTQSEL